MTPRDAMLSRVREALRAPTAPVVRGDPHEKPPSERDTPPTPTRIHSTPTPKPTPSGVGPDDARRPTAKAVNFGRDRGERGEEPLAPSISDDAPPTPPTEGPRAWLPPVGDDPESRVALFAALSEQLKTTFRRVADVPAAAGVVRGIAAAEGWPRVGVHRHPLVDAVAAHLGLPTVRTDGPARYDPAALETCPAGLTACDALVAQTASVLLSTRSAGGRALSVLPEHHVVLATADQLVPDLPAAWRLVRTRYADAPAGLPSYVGLVTGPSRTGDIERILVLGAHGPKRLTVVLIDAPAD